MATLAVPGASTVTRRPLSNHGMPKPPCVPSPEFPHRFSALKPPSSSTHSGFTSPRSPGPMSPPMSARSFGTVIDSEPSTPAYSPRMDYDWEDSTLVLLRPMSSSSEPSSPSEPVWDMIQPQKKSQQATGLFARKEREYPTVVGEPLVPTRLDPPPKKHKPFFMPQPAKDVKIDLNGNEPQHPRRESDVEGESFADQSAENNTAPFGKLASKVKLMLRRKSTTHGKKKEKKEKEKNYYDPEEELHWTEM